MIDSRKNPNRNRAWIETVRRRIWLPFGWRLLVARLERFEEA